MKMTRMFILMLSAILLLTATVQAQDSTWQPKDQMGHKSMMSQQRIHWNDYNNPPMSQLNLTQQQRVRIDSLYDHYQGVQEKLHNDQSLTDAVRNDRMRNLWKEEETGMNQILTMEQRNQLKTWRQQNRSNGAIKNHREPMKH